MSQIHTFAGNPLDRADAARRDPEWLSAAERDANSLFLPLWQLNVLLQSGDDTRAALGWIAQAEAARLDIEVPPVLLGVDDDGRAHFALDVSALGDPTHELGLADGWRFEDVRAAAMILAVPESGIIAQARSQVDWHRRHRFCSVCGSRSAQDRGGLVRRCPGCGAEHFPRTDPVAIMLIGDGERCLLGQSVGRLARTGMYSALAGFIDQGESIEEAVRREVLEEAGIVVGEVRYHSSQPWPFPSSLMIGCIGTARSTHITIDPNEMADVAWFHRTDVARAMAEDHPTLRLPGPIAIAHHLIRGWLEETAG